MVVTGLLVLALGGAVAGLGHVAEPGGRTAPVGATVAAGLFGAASGALIAFAVLGWSHRTGALELATLVAAFCVSWLQRHRGARIVRPRP